MKSSYVFLVMRNVSHADWSYRLDHKTVVLGNGVHCQVWIPNVFGGLSSEHAELGADGGRRWLRDLGSTSGTAINGVYIDHMKRASLEIDDSIWMGGVEIEVHVRIASVAHVTPKTANPSSSPDPAIWANPSRSACAILTPTETELLLWFSRGLTNAAQLVRKLGITKSTAETHIKSIHRKLKVRSQGELEHWLKEATRIGGGAKMVRQ